MFGEASRWTTATTLCLAPVDLAKDIDAQFPISSKMRFSLPPIELQLAEPMLCRLDATCPSPPLPPDLLDP